ncbi:hypothetical protein [Paenibacillus macerans]|uniref:hypothetical protein n=1 Tax=Paenibacillus macerans TaxID=44252 RepID=UPI00203AA63E|nr:hypothetical protein [Paenibacillus macerans]MCM3701894.1 hypothetical protein [Paenibacillus macerans]
MRNRLIGSVCIAVGVVVFAIHLFHSPEEQQVYVYPPDAKEEAIHEVIQSSNSQLIVNGCSIPHKTVSKEISQAEAKKMREEAGYSSEGVTGGVIVEFEETGPCS